MTAFDSPQPKFRRRAEDRPDELLDAARDLFLEQGYAHTSVAQIAKAAGVSKGAVYLYFPSKQAILEGLVKRAVAPISAEAMAGMAHSAHDVRGALTLFMKLLANRLADPQVFAIPRIVIREAAAVPEIAEMYRRAVLEPAIPAITALLAEGVARGELRPINPELTLRSIVGPIVTHVILSEIFGITPAQGLSMPELIDNNLDILFHGLFTEIEST